MKYHFSSLFMYAVNPVTFLMEIRHLVDIFIYLYVTGCRY